MDGRGRSRTQENPEPSVWDEHIRLSKKNKNHVFSNKESTQAAIARGIYDQQVLIARNDIMAITHNATLELRAPFPSALSKPSIWGFYIRRNDQQSPSFQNFAANYSAKHFLNFMIDNKPYKWLNDGTIVTDTGIELRCEQGPALEELMEYKFKGQEADWEIPEPYKSTFYKIRDGKKTTPLEMPPKRERKNRQMRETPDNGPPIRRPSKDGLTSIADIATELKIDPREARRILRSKITKPDAGWAWPADQVDGIKKIIKENV